MAEIIIIGAGAAGLMAAGRACELGHSVIVLEHMPKPGRKLLITGKGRCNITNDCDAQEFMKNVRTNSRFLYSVLTAFSPADVMNLFENQLSVPLKTERGRRVFPQSDRAETVLNALIGYASAAKFVQGEAEALLINGDKVEGVVLADKQKIKGDAVIVATGGMSYAVTGSTGKGYDLAKQAGHSIVEPLPSLVSMVEKGNTAKRLMGLSLKNVKLTLLENQKAVFTEQGEMLFTHFGISGPLVLSASAFLGDMQKNNYEVSIDLKPALSYEQLDGRLKRDFAEILNKDAANSLVKLLPAKMRPVAAEIWAVDSDRKVNQITREERQRLCALIKDFKIKIANRGDLEHAVITSGGVDVKQVNPKTMQSKLKEGLYFAGEVLDVDAYTGGYNLQVAWSTGYAAANSI